MEEGQQDTSTTIIGQATGVSVDRVTQLQDSIDQQCQMLFSSLHYLHKKAGMVQVAQEIPITQQNTNADNLDEFTARTREIADDICRQAKKIDTLVDSLPGASVSERDQERGFERLKKEDAEATKELEAANQRARELLGDISEMLRNIADRSGSQ